MEGILQLQLKFFKSPIRPKETKKKKKSPLPIKNLKKKTLPTRWKCYAGCVGIVNPRVHWGMQYDSKRAIHLYLNKQKIVD